MKTTTTILLLSIVLFITACMSTQTSHTEISVLRDVTDTSIVQPQADEIIKLYDFPKSQWNGGIFRYSDISEVSINPTQEVSINADNPWLSNEFQRKDDIKLFEKRIADIILQAKLETTSQNNSSVYLPIADELNLLSQNKSEKRILIVYSDLMENSDIISFYKNKDFALLKTKPEHIQQQFESLVNINSLSGIEIYFIYQPTDPISDIRFQVISDFYRKLMESKKAEVHIGANLNF